MKTSPLFCVVLGLLALGPGCATARLVGPPLQAPPTRVGEMHVVLEPFFETSHWRVQTEARTATVYPGQYGGGYGGYRPYGSGIPQDVTLYQQVAHKAVYARPQVLAQEQSLVLAEVQRLRPGWRVYSTAALQSITGPVVLVRTVVGDSEVIAGNRTLMSLAFGFSFVLPPLFLLQINPVDETQRISGSLQRYDVDATTLKAKLLRYATQPDFAVDTRGLAQRTQAFALDIEYQEGLLASEASRDPVLVRGFVQKLAAATIALIEGF